MIKNTSFQGSGDKKFEIWSVNCMEKVDMSAISPINSKSNEIFIINPHGVLIQVKPEEEARLRKLSDGPNSSRVSSFFSYRNKKTSETPKLKLYPVDGNYSTKSSQTTPSPVKSPPDSEPSSPKSPNQSQVLILAQANHLDHLSTKSTESFFLSRVLSFKTKSTSSKLSTLAHKTLTGQDSLDKSQANNPINNPQVKQLQLCVPNIVTSSKGKRPYQTMHFSSGSSIE